MHTPVGRSHVSHLRPDDRHRLPVWLVAVAIGVVFSLGPAGPLSADPQTRTVGPVNLIFYNNGDSNGIYTGQSNWTVQQMDDVAASMTVWSERITNVAGRQINLQLFWNEFGSNSTLGGTYAPSNGDGSIGWSYVENVWRNGVNYAAPWSQWDALIRLDITAAGASWNFGAGSPSPSAIDFRGVVTHEIGHMLGFNSSYSTYPSISDRWGVAWGTSSSPTGYAGYRGLLAWDQYLRDDDGNRPAVGSRGTPGNFDQGDNPVWFIGSNAVAFYGSRVPIYAPTSFSDGSSLVHLDEASLPSALMSPFASQGQAIRQPTRLEWEMMRDMGWSVTMSRSWTGGAGTLNWSDAANWSPQGPADIVDDALFGVAGLAGGETINMGGSRSVNLLTISSTADYTLGGPSGTLTIVQGRLIRTADAAGVQTIARPIAMTANAIFQIDGAGKLVLSDSITGASTKFEKTGSGTLVLGGISQYAGTTTILAGSVVLAVDAPSGAAGALGNSTQPVLLGDTSGLADVGLLIEGSHTLGRDVTVRAGSSGTATLGGAGDSGVSVFAGGINLEKWACLTAPDGGEVLFSGDITGNFWLAKIGDGAVALSGNNAFTGDLTIWAGTVRVGSATALGVSGILLYGGGMSSSSAAPATIGRPVIVGAPAAFGSADPVHNGPLTFTSTVGLTGSWAFTVYNDTTFVSTVYGNDCSLTKSGPGTLTLSSNNTFGGVGQSVTVTGGLIRVSSNANFGHSANSVRIDGGGVRFSGSFSTTRSFVVGAGGAIFDVDDGEYVELAGEIVTVAETFETLAAKPDGAFVMEDALLFEKAASMSILASEQAFPEQGPAAPEPATMSLLLGGLAAIGLSRRLRQRHAYCRSSLL